MSKTESMALRGLAILGIVLHNYCHFLGFAVKENEYTFTAEKPLQLWDKLMVFDKDLFIHLFSFFGHYGVPIFLFISGYGLVKKYEGTMERGNVGAMAHGNESSWHWIWKHFVKLFKLMIYGYLLFMVVYFLRYDSAPKVFTLDRIVAQLTMTINFLYTVPDQAIRPGPYWFFGLMIQLYILYRLVFYRWRNAFLLVMFVVVCWLLQTWATQYNPTSYKLLNYIRYNFVGGILPFCMGIAYARYFHYTLSAAQLTGIVLLSAVAVFAGSFSVYTWLWVPLFIVTGAVATVKLLPQWLMKPCVWFGGISSALFVMHPVMRELIIAHYRKIDIYWGIVIYLLSAVALSMLYQFAICKISARKGTKNNKYGEKDRVLGFQQVSQ